MIPNVPKDILGQRIERGRIVVMPKKSGNRTFLALREVEAVNTSLGKVYVRGIEGCHPNEDRPANSAPMINYKRCLMLPPEFDPNECDF